MPSFDKKQLPQLAQEFEKGANIGELRGRYGLGNKALFRRLVEARRQNLISEAAISRLVIDRTQYDFPRNPEARLEAILSCTNSELKNATLLMFDRYPRTYWGIYKRLTNLMIAKLPWPTYIRSYCALSFVPIGFLVKELFERSLGRTTSYFTISEAGEKYGRPLAAFSLKYAVDNNLSLHEMLGSTISTGDSRPPYNRIRIMELVERGCNRIVNVSKETGLSPSSVTGHLKQLQRLGVLEFESLKTERKGIKTYTWVEGKLPEEAEICGTFKTLTADVANWLYGNRTGEYRQIASELNRARVYDICSILVGLQKQGLVDARFTSRDRSDIVLCECPHPLRTYARIVRSTLEHDDLKEADAVLAEFIHDKTLFKQYLNAGIELYRSIAPMANAVSLEKRRAEILEFIKIYQKEHGRGPRLSEIKETLGQSYGILYRPLQLLMTEGFLVKERKGPGVFYTAV